MKRVCGLVICFALLLCGCGSANQDLVEQNQQLQDRIKSLEERIIELEREIAECAEMKVAEEDYFAKYQSKKVISKEEFETYFETVELTMDNCDKYFEIYIKSKIGEDVFGEPTGVEYHDYYMGVREEFRSNMFFKENVKCNMWVKNAYVCDIYEDGKLTDSVEEDYGGEIDSFEIWYSTYEKHLSSAKMIYESGGKWWHITYSPGFEIKKVEGIISFINVPEEK